MSDDIHAIKNTWCDALNAHDPDAVADAFTEDAVFDNGNQVSEGRDAIRGATAGWLATISEFHVEERLFVADGDTWAEEWIMTGLHSGDMPGLPATGRRFSVPGATVGIVRDGKVARATLHWNFAALLAQVGALPAPA